MPRQSRNDHKLNAVKTLFQLIMNSSIVGYQSEEEAEEVRMLVEQRGGMRQATASRLGSEEESSTLKIQIRLAGGIGISVINSVPEELVFINLEQIEVCNSQTAIDVQ